MFSFQFTMKVKKWVEVQQYAPLVHCSKQQQKNSLKPKRSFFCQDTCFLILTFEKYMLVQAYGVWIKA